MENDWKSKFIKIGLPDAYVPTGEYSFVLNECGLNVNDIFTKINTHLD